MDVLSPTLQATSAPLTLLSAAEPVAASLQAEAIEEAIQPLAAGDFSVTPQWNLPQAELTSALGDVSGLTNVTISLTGSTEAAGKFENDPFGLGSGIVLSTGRAADQGPSSKGPARPRRRLRRIMPRSAPPMPKATPK